MAPSRERCARAVAVALVVVLVGLLAPGRAAAHADFDFSNPTDGAVVGAPVSEVVVGFTLPVTLVGPGFEALDPQGNVIYPFIVTTDNTVFRLQFDPPLAGGVAAVKWEAAAEDGHTLSGSFSFTVPQAAVTTTTSSTPATSAPAVTSLPDTTTTVAATTPPSATTATPATTAAPAGDGSSTNVALAVAVAVALASAAFLVVRSRGGGGAR